MAKQPKHRLHREFPEAKRVIVECDLNTCPHCGSVLRPRKPWHSRKHVQTLEGPLFVAGRSKECSNAACSHAGEHYYASRLLMISLPYSTYGLDVLAFIGWQHEHEHKHESRRNSEHRSQGSHWPHLSHSPITKSRLPSTAGTSLTRQPGKSSGRILRFTKDGARIFNRYGTPPPLLLM